MDSASSRPRREMEGAGAERERTASAESEAVAAVEGAGDTWRDLRPGPLGEFMRERGQISGPGRLLNPVVYFAISPISAMIGATSTERPSREERRTASMRQKVSSPSSRSGD
jgi:hypothetical protein